MLSHCENWMCVNKNFKSWLRHVLDDEIKSQLFNRFSPVSRINCSNKSRIVVGFYSVRSPYSNPRSPDREKPVVDDPDSRDETPDTRLARWFIRRHRGETRDHVSTGHVLHLIERFEHKRDGITAEAPFLTIIIRTCISADSLSLASPLFLLRLSRDQDKRARKKLRLLESSSSPELWMREGMPSRYAARESNLASKRCSPESSSRSSRHS